MATVVWSIFQFIYFVCFVVAMTLLYENKKLVQQNGSKIIQIDILYKQIITRPGGSGLKTGIRQP